MPDSQTTVSYGITALGSALQVLEVIGQSPGLRASQIAAETGLTKSKVFRILRTLQEAEYVRLDQRHAAYLDRAAFLLGKHAAEQYSLARSAQPVLDQLAAETQESVHLVVREGLHSLVIDVRTSPQPVRMYAQVGRIGPLHAGGTSKVLLAYAPPEVIDMVLASPLSRYTDATLDSPGELRPLLAQIRQDGYHVAVSDLSDQTFSVAAPVFDHHGEVAAALSVAGPLMRLDASRQERYLRLVRAAAARLLGT
ncbi:IclR family transcriptional regulator [Deinococcus irradiatisoli]|uniref:IclR family transcriptional regulator n=1 Tax=Deinococcus irradiatisoli TaxID=2202254 RepID=A0A2Z3JBH2_9DEIO|nr:IclR family transcriptional regulator [Deinococcus irradiatisoli]AWN22497.1 IclR family transcriptional regulator [Deinococcus irradiatisoli]